MLALGYNEEKAARKTGTRLWLSEREFHEYLVNLRKTTSEIEGCWKHASFNKPGALTAIRCGDHKESGMVDVVSKKCQFEGCGKQLLFNKPGALTAIRCGGHKKPGMINVRVKTCQVEGCWKQQNGFTALVQRAWFPSYSMRWPQETRQG